MIRVASLAALAGGRGLRVEAHGCRIALFRVGVEVFAIDDTCPHRGGPLSEGDLEQGAIACPIHGWAFDLRTGEMRGSSGVRVGTYAVELRGEDVWVGPRRS